MHVTERGPVFANAEITGDTQSNCPGIHPQDVENCLTYYRINAHSEVCMYRGAPAEPAKMQSLVAAGAVALPRAPGAALPCCMAACASVAGKTANKAGQCMT